MSSKLITQIAAAAFMVSVAQLPASAQTGAEEGTEGESSARLATTTTVVCRRLAPPTGTRIGARRVCRTEYEWRQLEQEYRRYLEDRARTRRNCGSDAFPCGG